MYKVCLVDNNGSIVRYLDFENESEAIKKVSKWKKLFPKNTITLNNVIK